MFFKVVPMSYAEIDRASGPVNADEPEAIPFVLFDSLTYLAAGTTVSQKFFQQNQGDPTISNVNGGSLPEGESLRIARMGYDILAVPAAVAGHSALAEGPIYAISRILKTARGVFSLKLSQKDYGPIPLTFSHASGGETGFGWGTFTAEASLAFGNNGTFDGGFPTDNSLYIKSKTQFSVTTQFASGGTTITVDTLTRFWLAGTLYRRVV